ncbi:Conserved_hypothetical protein [Hexamita inflata]|uniref:Uncharacterized protein n=1 Tax=Hexamita inflata TaxID=28002 RepID=A0AA86UPQ3_9EUKA|nr:Conserved hypothetical protein [Hexamita inflata]CAI9968657.1 Conserved hypothetical protein [Hexamita inflata]
MLFTITIQLLYLYDPNTMLDLAKLSQIHYSHASAAEMFATLSNQPHHGMFDMTADIFKYYDCVVMTTKEECNPQLVNCDWMKMKMFEQSGTLSAQRSYYSNYTTTGVTCTKDNTAVMMFDAKSDERQQATGLTVFIILFMIIAFIVVAWFFTSMDEEAPDDADDDMNPLLFQSPEMLGAPEAFLDDEPWEAGGDDY